MPAAWKPAAGPTAGVGRQDHPYGNTRPRVESAQALTRRESAMPPPLPIARNAAAEFSLLPGMANRHGLVTGATGTGKTVTLQVLAERFSAIGVPVFMADVKGDLAGLSQPGQATPKLAERLKLLGIEAPPFM